MILNNIQIILGYKENHEEIINIINKYNNSISYEDARIKDYEETTKWQSAQIASESNHVISLFLKELGCYDNDICSKINVNCYDGCKNELMGFVDGIGVVNCNFKYHEYKDLSIMDKQKSILNLIDNAFRIISKDIDWDMKPIDKAIDQVQKREFKNIGIALKSKKNKAKNYSAQLLYNYQIDKIEFFMSIIDKNHNEIKCERVLKLMPESIIFKNYIGSIKWISNNEVALLNKSGHIDNIVVVKA